MATSEVTIAEEPLPEWACPECWGYGITGGFEAGAFVDYACPTCNGSGVKPGVTPPVGGGRRCPD